MEKEFIPYKLALRLKELGFNEKCFGYYTKDKEFFYFDVDDLSSAYTKNMDNLVVNSVDGLECTAPLYQQAFRWFREKYQIFPEVLTDCTTEPKFVYTYNTFYGNPKDLTEQEWGWENNIDQYSDIYRTYEEAELATLEKLIEIVETKSE